MNVTVSLPPELESSLRATAAAAGKNLATLILEAVEEKLARDHVSTKSGGGETGPDPLTYGEWKRRFETWMAGVERRGPRYTVGFVVDDSRSSIYEGRGE